MSEIASNIIVISKSLPESVKLVAVSKTMPPAVVMEAYNAGHRVFGENRVQELLNKKDLLPHDIEWHLIGHLQRNKVKYIVPFISMIQSVDSVRLLKTVDDEATKAGRVVDVLLQVHIAREEAKFGFSKPELEGMLGSGELRSMRGIRIRGLMGMATFTDDGETIRSEFRFLAGLFRELHEKFFDGDPLFSELSMGMSGDYRIAVSEGSTMVRIGSLIFGERKIRH